MNSKLNSRAIALILAVTFLGPTVSAGCEWAGPGNKGWRCKRSKDCKGKLRCRQYWWPKRKKLIRLCSKRGAKLTNKSVYGWVHITLFWAFIIGFPLTIAILVIVAKIRQKKESKGAPPGGPPPPGDPPPPDAPPPEGHA